MNQLRQLMLEELRRCNFADTTVRTYREDGTWNVPPGTGGGTSPLTTKGDLFGFDTAANRIPVGSNGQVLTADSTQALGVKWAAAGGGGGALVLLEQHTASNSASLDFTTSISSTYDEYQIELIDVLPATNADQLAVRFSTNGGTSYDTASNYRTVGNYFYSGGSGVNNATTGFFGLQGNISNNVLYGGWGGRITLHNPLGTSSYKKMIAEGFDGDTSVSGDIVMQKTICRYLVTTAVNAIRFFFTSGGNITSGTIRIYGIAH